MAPIAMAERASDRWVSIVLSVLLHGALVALLGFGWWMFRRAQPPTPTLAIEATVVDARAVNGAALQPPQPAPQPPPPAPQPPPPDTQPQVEPDGPPEPTPEELAQREQAQKEQAAKEQAAREEAERQVQEQKLAEERKAQEQRQAEIQRQAEEEQRKADERKAEEQRKAQERAEAERKAREAEEKKRAEEKRLAEQKRQEEAQRQAEARDKADREAELKRSLQEEERLAAVQSSGAAASWKAQIQARIQRAWLQPPTAKAGLECVLTVTQVPGGEVTNVTIGRCNGDQAVRESIAAAVYRASPLPPPPDPALFERELTIIFRPN